MSITGGEPFHDLKTTRRIGEIARQRGLLITIVTSAFWAKSEAVARAVLAETLFVDRLVISCDVFHLKFVPVAFVQNAYRAAKSLNIEVRVRIVHDLVPGEAEISLSETILQFVEEYEIERQLLANYGRARDAGIGSAGVLADQRDYCPSSGPHIRNDGSVVPCCGAVISIEGDHPFLFGNVMKDDCSVIYSRFLENPLFALLKIGGVALLREVLGPLVEEPLEGMSICDLCYRVCSSHDLHAAIRKLLNEPFFQLEMYSFAVFRLGLNEFLPLMLEASRLLEVERHWSGTESACTTLRE